MRRTISIGGLRLRFDLTGPEVVTVTEAPRWPRRGRAKWVGNVNHFGRPNGALLRLSNQYRDRLGNEDRDKVIAHAELVKAAGQEPWPYCTVTGAVNLACILLASGAATVFGAVCGLLALKDILGYAPVDAAAVMFLAAAAFLLFTGARGFQLALVALLPTLARDMSEFTNWRRYQETEFERLARRHRGEDGEDENDGEDDYDRREY